MFSNSFFVYKYTALLGKQKTSGRRADPEEGFSYYYMEQIITLKRNKVCYEFKKMMDIDESLVATVGQDRTWSTETLNEETCLDYCVTFSTPGVDDTTDEYYKHFHEQLCNHKKIEKNSKVIELVGSIMVVVGFVVFVVVQFFDANKLFRLIPTFVCFIGALLCAVTTILLQASNSTFEKETKVDLISSDQVSMNYESCFFMLYIGFVAGLIGAIISSFMATKCDTESLFCSD